MLNKLRDIPNINEGGCGIAALVIYRQLKEVGFNPTILFMYGDGEDSEFLKNLNLEANWDDLYAPEHVAIALGDHVFDAFGRPPTDAYSGWHSVSDSELVRCINSPTKGMWNSDFNRAILKQYPDILSVIPDVRL